MKQIRLFITESKKKKKERKKENRLGSDCRLYSNLFIAPKSRQVNLDFFSHESHIYSVSLRNCTAKSDFLDCLEELISPLFEHPVIQVKLLMALLLWICTSRDLWRPLYRTDGEYCFEELPNKIVSLTQNIERIDLVFGSYQTASKQKQVKVEVLEWECQLERKQPCAINSKIFWEMVKTKLNYLL